MYFLLSVVHANVFTTPLEKILLTKCMSPFKLWALKIKKKWYIISIYEPNPFFLVVTIYSDYTKLFYKPFALLYCRCQIF